MISNEQVLTALLAFNYGELGWSEDDEYAMRSALEKAGIQSMPTHKSEAYAKAEAAFADYFIRNYPGPDTIIYDPAWHAPKLFHAAFRALKHAASGGNE